MKGSAQLDQAGRKLIAAAQLAEKHWDFEEVGGGLHPIRALFIVCNARKTLHYRVALRRIFEVIGTDMMDLSQAETIDLLVAAAYWENK
jgi:hypothetical protein